MDSQKVTSIYNNSYIQGGFDSNVLILESHPSIEEIIFSANYDGFIMIWNIEENIILNTF